MTREEAKDLIITLRKMDKAEQGLAAITGWDVSTGIYGKAADAIEELLERDRWIKASTPPDTNRFVLVMNDDGRCGVAQYVGDDIAPITPWQIAYCLYDVDTWDDEEQGPVCWWKELPEPPKEET